MRTILCNVFTTAMLDSSYEQEYNFRPISIDEAKIALRDGFEQAVGHPSTCEILSQRLGVQVIPTRANVRLNYEPYEFLVVAQVVVARLAEGQVLSKEEVEALPIQFWLISCCK